MEKHFIFDNDSLFIRKEIMEDMVLCSELVDRLCNKADLANMTGPSYRVR